MPITQIMTFLFKIIGFISIALMIFSVYIMIKSMRRDQRVKVRSLLIPIFSSLAFLILYCVILKSAPASWLSILLVLAGLAVGILWSRTTLMSLKNNNVVGKRSPWYLVIWGATIAFTQLMSMMASPSTVVVGISTIFFSTGLSVGTNSSLLVRRQKLASGIKPQEQPQNALKGNSSPVQKTASGIKATQKTCSNCGEVNPAGLKYCVNCGRLLLGGQPTVPPLATANSCRNCGFPLQPNLKFCTHCGLKLVQKG